MEKAREVRPWESDKVIGVDLVSVRRRYDESTFQGEVSNSISIVLIMCGTDSMHILILPFYYQPFPLVYFNLTIFKLS